jgi:hypothetical protein
MTKDWLSEVGAVQEQPSEGTIAAQDAILNYIILSEYHRVSELHLLIEAEVRKPFSPRRELRDDDLPAIEAAYHRLVPQPIIPTTLADRENFALFEAAWRRRHAGENTP